MANSSSDPHLRRLESELMELKIVEGDLAEGKEFRIGNLPWIKDTEGDVYATSADLQSLQLRNGEVVSIKGSAGSVAGQVRLLPSRAALRVENGWLWMSTPLQLSCAPLGERVLVTPLRHPLPALQRLTLDASSTHGVFLSSSAQRLALAQLRGRLLSVGTTVRVALRGVPYSAVVTTTDPPLGYVTSATQLDSAPSDVPLTDNHWLTSDSGDERLGGLESAGKALLEAVTAPLAWPQLSGACGVRPTGVLLTGPPGAGKSQLGRWLVSQGVRCCRGNAAEWLQGAASAGEEALRASLARVTAAAPAVWWLENVDSLSSGGAVGRRLSVALAAAVRSALADRVVSVAVATSPDRVARTLRVALAREVTVAVPSATERAAMVEWALRDVPHQLTPVTITAVAQRCHGFVAGDVAVMVREAALKAVTRLPEDPCVTDADMWAAVRSVRPSALRHVTLEVPTVRWSDIGGYEDVKQALQEAVEWPLKHPQVFERMGIQPPRGVLLYGPPGCSKTMMAKALATESGLNFLAVKGPELFSKWVGQSEKAVREIFRKARAAAPSILFFDEIDALATQRGGSQTGAAERVVSQLLVELQGIGGKGPTGTSVVFVAATNRPDLLDAALLRPGRIDRRVFVALPDRSARVAIATVAVAALPLGESVTRVTEAVAEATEGLAGAEVRQVCREAARAALRSESAVVSLAHFVAAAKAARPRTPADLLAAYRRFHANASLLSLTSP